MSDVVPSLLSGKRVHIAGSAAASAPAELLARAHDFVCALVRSVLALGGGVVVFAAGEPTSSDNLPLTFDWTVLRLLDRELRPPCASPRGLVVTTTKARTQKLSPDNADLLERLCRTGIVDLVVLPEDRDTGGDIRAAVLASSDAVVCISGGKGVTNLAAHARERKMPLLPFDIVLGAAQNDGEGAVALHRRLFESPETFFERTGAALPRAATSWSIMRPVLPLEEIADQCAAAIGRELSTTVISPGIGSHGVELTERENEEALRRRYTGVYGAKVAWLALVTLLPVFLAMKIPAIKLEFAPASIVYVSYHLLGIWVWAEYRQLQQSPIADAQSRAQLIRKLMRVDRLVYWLGWAVACLLALTLVSLVHFQFGGARYSLAMPEFVKSMLGVGGR